MKYFFVLLFLFSTSTLAGGSIGFGYVKGVKIGNDNSEDLKIYLKPGFTNDEYSCNGVIVIKKSNLNDARFEMIYSATLAAYMSGKKVRCYSHSNNCNATFVAIQEESF